MHSITKTLFDVLKNLENEESQIVLIINEKGKLLNISDGDIRRHLSGNTLETKVLKI